jgi:hypothetical protein
MFMKIFGKILLVLVVMEVSLCGGGRLFYDGMVTPRYVLFGLGLAYSVSILLCREKIPPEFVFLTVAFIGLSVISAITSILKSMPTPAALYDLKPLAYFLLLPFFAATIRSVDDVMLVAKIWKFSALALAGSFLAVMAMWKLDLVTATQLVDFLNPTHDPRLEFYFRGETTFYFKALLYVGVGVFFFIDEKKWARNVAVLMLLLAIALTMTRGMLLSVCLVLSAWAYFHSNNQAKNLMLAAGFLLVGVVGVVWINATLESVKLSNEIRINDLKWLMDISLHWQTVLFGQGFGAPILGREAIEIAYVNVFIKQGVIGIIFWLLPPFYLAWLMRSINDSGRRALAMPYFMSAALVYVMSLTNPFLTNPIGMSIVMIAMVAVRVVNQSSSKDLMKPLPCPVHC